MNYGLPKTLPVGGEEQEIRADYRAVLDICAALNDPALSPRQKQAAALTIFYLHPERIPPALLGEALEQCFRFITGGQEERGPRGPRLMDWEQDFPYIVAPVNRVLGREIRDIPYDPRANTGGLHWWSFLSAFYEIGGDCTFAQIVALRLKLLRHEKLDKAEKDWLRRNRHLVELRAGTTRAEEALLAAWT